jgi:hypothetical protein
VNSSSPSPAPRLARQATAREFLAILFRRKWIILGLFLVTTATVFTVALTTPKAYISSGRVLIKRGERYSSLHADRQVFSDWEQDLGTQMQVMKSQPVIKRSRELVAELARQEHQQVTFDPGKIDLEVVGKSNVIAMGYTDLDPAAAQIACKALMQAYLEYHKDRLNSDRSKPFLHPGDQRHQRAHRQAHGGAALDHRAERHGVAAGADAELAHAGLPARGAPR